MRSQPVDLRRARRFAIALCVVAAPVSVGVIRTITPVVDADTAARVVPAFADHLGAVRVTFVFDVIAAMLLPFLVMGLYRLTARRVPVLAAAGAVLALAGWVMLPFLAAQDILGYELARAGGDPAIWDRFTASPAFAASLFIFIVAHELGMVLLGVALWRSRAVAAWAGAAVAVGTVAHLAGVVSDTRAVDVIGFAVMIAGCVAAARAILATPDDEWDLRPAATAPHTAAADSVTAGAAVTR
ncbi:hypothetical protein Daura_33455 [Dactylosporangium aurantiacum]|uniref:DUF4386 family protein n=1 Tax=Dactylosporangium aurantiacum TaxID=35754 RepID=A0A9Q9IEA9_9ACTN|nr:hypothetical protein [Dactylosporangium aurantiacum]MDG6105101.1 hypothetical protein [Dactylosporangium aurantiacum]UWZ51628.1 hypothetical protein Daura_33455 [Dactylosporangium aurantiacum]